MRVMVGMVSTLLFLVFGITLLSAESRLLGAGICALAVFRGLVLARQFLHLFPEPED
jgi:hypothetical protein